MLAACGSPSASRFFYTLGGGERVQCLTDAGVVLYRGRRPSTCPGRSPKSQLVVQTSPAQVRVLEDERWASLPGDEVRRALSADLAAQQLGAIDVHNTPHHESVPV